MERSTLYNSSKNKSEDSLSDAESLASTHYSVPDLTQEMLAFDDSQLYSEYDATQAAGCSYGQPMEDAWDGEPEPAGSGKRKRSASDAVTDFPI